MLLDFLRPTVPWQGKHALDLPHALAMERTLARVRVVLVVASIAVNYLERSVHHGVAAKLIFAALLVHALVALYVVETGRIRIPQQAVFVHAVDVAGILGVMFFTGGLTSPFSSLFFFAMLAAGYRWGGPEVALTCAVAVVVMTAQAFVGPIFGLTVPDGHIVVLRLVYITIGGGLIGLVSETERRHRYRAIAVSRILSRVRVQGGLVAAIQAVMDELLPQFGADHAVLVLEEEGDDRAWVWHAEPASGESRRVGVKLRQGKRADAAHYLFPVPEGADAWKVSRSEGGGADDVTLVALDGRGERIKASFSVAPLFDAPFPWRTTYCLSTFSDEGWRARLFLFLPRVPRGRREQLRYLQVVVRQVGPALLNLYLQRRLQSRAGVVERARIARELHDGVIQSLIGVEMQLEVLRREVGAGLSEAAAGHLVKAQKVLGQEILDVRDLMHLLRPGEVDARRLVEHLADIVERFRQRTSIQARFSCDVEEIDLPQRVCRELGAIVQEALTNVRKHSGATSVLVRLGVSDGYWQLIIDDNGCGLDFEGYLSPDEVERLRKGPVIIKERVRAIGGRLAMHSQPRYGARLEITIPRKHHG